MTQPSARAGTLQARLVEGLREIVTLVNETPSHPETDCFVEAIKDEAIALLRSIEAPGESSRDEQQELQARSFTELCREMLTNQPDQLSFNISRSGLETLVLDSERYGETNRQAVEKYLAFKRLYPEPPALEAQVSDLATKWPGTELIDPPNDRGQRWLRIPGVKLPKPFVPSTTTMWLRIESGFPMVPPHRFFTDPDVRFPSGGPPSHTSQYLIDGRELAEHFWVVKSWDWRRDTLRTYVMAMLQSFNARAT